MTRDEFMREVCRRVPGGSEPILTDKEYAVIEHVYARHPSIDPVEGKQQIAELYVGYGMALIMDMVPRADLMEEKRNELLAAKAVCDRIKEEMEEIRRGGPI